MATPARKLETVATKETAFSIKPPNIVSVAFNIRGTAPYMQHRFSKKAELMLKHEAGSTGRSKRVKSARDFNADYEAAKHVSEEGWIGIPAPAFRNALISACRLVGFKMTLAKLSVFVIADGYDAQDSTPLVRIHGEPVCDIRPATNATGVIDLRARPLWREWGATLRIRFDADQFTVQDVAHLLERAGQQVGVGEGRPDSKSSPGIGFGTFTGKDESE